MQYEDESWGAIESGEDRTHRLGDRALGALATVTRRVRGQRKRFVGGLVGVVGAVALIGVWTSGGSTSDTSRVPTVTTEDGHSTFRPPPIRPTQVPYPFASSR